MTNPAPLTETEPKPFDEAAWKLQNQEVRNLLSKARTRLVARLPFFGRIAMQMSPRAARPCDGVCTAGIARDGTAVFNYDYLTKPRSDNNNKPLSAKQIAGVVAHEALHPSLQFWARKGSRHHLMANIAHDLSFNFWIEEMACGEIELPPGVLLDEKFHGMSMEEIYNYLRKGDNGSGKTIIKTKGGGSIVVDTTGGGGEAHEDCRDDLSATKDGKKAAAGHKDSQKKLDNFWKMTLAEAAQEHEKRNKSRGTMPAGLKRYIEELLHPKLDWKEELQRWAGNNGRRQQYSFARPHRRSQAIGIMLPSPLYGGYADIVFLIDTSGSMSKDEIKRGMSEAQGILEELGSTIRVLVCDAAVHGDVTIEDAYDVEIKGGGGSNFNPAFELLREDGFAGAVVAFTDGMIGVPHEKPPGIQGVLWLCPNGYSAPTEDWGDYIEMPKEKDEDES